MRGQVACDCLEQEQAPKEIKYDPNKPNKGLRIEPNINPNFIPGTRDQNPGCPAGIWKLAMWAYAGTVEGLSPIRSRVLTLGIFDIFRDATDIRMDEKDVCGDASARDMT